MKTFTATKARQNFFKIIEMASQPGSSVGIILKGGESEVVMMSKEEFEGWVETLEIMGDKKLMKDIRAAQKEKGGTPWEEVKKKFLKNSHSK